jgi:hypothetical protein
MKSAHIGIEAAWSTDSFVRMESHHLSSLASSTEGTEGLALHGT